MSDLFGYAGERVVIDGAASGMGLAATKVLADLGAEVYALDVKEVPAAVKKYIPVDLRQKDSIDAALAQVPGTVDSVFCCAGLPGRPFSEVDVVMVNFVGHRHLVESLLPRLSKGSAIAMISSVAGMGWMSNFAVVRQMLDTRNFEEARAWLEVNPKVITPRGYGFSKQCATAYVMVKADELPHRGIRINVLSPASTATPMLTYFEDINGRERLEYRTVDGRFATSEEMGEPLVFLNSNMARFISGHDLVVDNSTIAKDMVGQILKTGTYAGVGALGPIARYQLEQKG